MSDSDTSTDLKRSVSVPNDNDSRRRRRKKVDIACVYCRRSHMICDNSRPCQRCIKRGIGHLCYDEPSNARQRKKAQQLTKAESTPPYSLNQSQSPVQSPPQPSHQQPGSVQPEPLPTSAGTAPGPGPTQPPGPGQVLGPGQGPNAKGFNKSVLSQTMAFNLEPFFYSEHAGSEFSSLNDFLSMIDDPDLVNGALNDDTPGSNNMMNFGIENEMAPVMNTPNVGNGNTASSAGPVPTGQGNTNGNGNEIQNILSFSPTSNYSYNQFPPAEPKRPDPSPPDPVKTEDGHQPVISDSARDKFFLTAADPTTEISPEERLKQVIKAKLEAGLLQPYNYAKGYGRLQNYMDNYMNFTSRQRILKPLSVFRPAFRAIARTLKDVDLVLVEESFERMLLDYDRVFTSMAIPACLWRRTGEIYRGNKEFASLVGVTTDDLKDGKLAIYELMSEESAVNFWEKYGAIAFDKGQKAVLTSCNLRTRDGFKRKSCCFSFTIRRDRYNIPSCIVGNFIPIDP